MLDIRITIFNILLVYGLLSSNAVALDIDDTRHLLTRTGFSPAPHEFSQFESLSRKAAVKKIIQEIRKDPITQAPDIIFEQFYEANQSVVPIENGCTLLVGELKTSTPHDIYSRRYAEHYAMKKWWWTEMINTPSPLTERLTLMWHDHFATGFSVEAIRQFYNNQTLRSLAATDFKRLAVAMLRDPAMIYYLDNQKNVVSSPNENLAREFLELFTMGEGNYSQNDIKELAKVLAGHGLSDSDCSYQFHEDEAFKGEVTLFGKTGQFSIEEAVDIVFEQAEVSEFIVKKFWIEFISPDFTDEQIQPLAKSFRQSDYDIKHLLTKVLNHKAFWAQDNRGSLVKSPVELLVGMTRSFGIWMPDPDLVIGDSRAMNHDLFNPPNVAGWQENDGWINPLTAVLRSMTVDRVWRANANLNELRQQYTDLDDGLMIRVSSQQHPTREPRSFNVYINDQLVDHFTLKMGDKEDKKNAVNLIEEPEMLFIPSIDLPENIETVAIEYSVNEEIYADSSLPQFMLHWIEYEGLRYTANVATQTSTITPIGMLEESGLIRFDLNAIRNNYAKQTKTKREFMAYNTVTPIINELYSFGHEQAMPLAPAGLSYEALPADLLGDFKALADGKSQDLAGVPVLAILPKTTALTNTVVTSLQPLQALTQSPYYQRK